MDETGWLAPHFDSGCIECNDLESAVAYLRNLHPADSSALLAELVSCQVYFCDSKASDRSVESLVFS